MRKKSKLTKLVNPMDTTKKFSIDIDVRFRDLDAMGHVNNAVVFTYFEMGRINFFVQHLKSAAPPDFNFILAHVSCDYIKQILLQDTLRLHIWIGKIGHKSFDFGYELRDRFNEDIVFAKGESVQVCYDYDRNQTFPLPEPIKTKLMDYRHHD
jgi:acyl-CoA thioester hydrolase